jgi:hypothetical protein
MESRRRTITLSVTRNAKDRRVDDHSTGKKAQRGSSRDLRG